ncbi:MAG TPA: hypothetical protein VJJ23_01345 [Candidatus Nanoarchaeia archaeon]|nr:hypothetical protein [Candidatus Nanoarchaeia archaeon]
MDKRGQFFLIIAIIFSLALFTITQKFNRVEEATIFGDFQYLSKNYQQEAVKVVDYSIKKDEDKSQRIERLNTFTLDYLTFSRLTNPQVQLFYIYSDESTAFVKSYVDSSPVEVIKPGCDQPNPPQECEPINLFGANTETINSATLKVAGKRFTTDVPISIKNYGDYSEADLSGTDLVLIKIGSVFHKFKTNPLSPDLKLYIESSTQSTTEVYNSGGTQEFPPYLFQK